MNENLRRTFFEKAKKDEKKVVAAFVAENAEGALKTKPKVNLGCWWVLYQKLTTTQGFDADHKDLNLLRLRNFTLGRKISDADVLSEDGIDRIADIIGALVPWVYLLHQSSRRLMSSANLPTPGHIPEQRGDARSCQC